MIMQMESASKTTPAEPIIRLEGIYKRYGGVDALAGVHLQVSAGEMVFLTGHSGAGKSTLLKLIALMERPSRGRVLVEGRNLEHVSKREIPALRRGIGLVFQNHRLLPDRSVFDNVALPLVVAGHSLQEVGRRVRRALEDVGLLDREEYSPQSLSAGEQQRVGIARAVVAHPRIILADEPTGNLDEELSQDIIRLFEKFQHSGVAVLIATHDRALIAGMRHRIIHLSHGHLREEEEHAD